MKSIILTSVLAVFFCISNVNAQASKSTKITTNPSAKLFVDGVQVSTAAYNTKLKKGDCVHVRVEQSGYIPTSQTICNNGTLKNSYYISLEKDQAFESSVSTDIANRDFTLDSKRSPKDTWLIVSQILQDYFDVIEVIDENTGYMRTAWIVQNFNGSTVRTRVVVKLASVKPLSFKVKVQSEIAEVYGASVKEDQLFKEWGRLLRAYEPIVGELQGRIKPALLTKNN